jgi:choice-of-anchor C domain-containing protein
MKTSTGFLTGTMLLASLVALGADDEKTAKEKEVNLLVNGSFEEGPEIGGMGFNYAEKGSKDIKGWEVTRAQIDYIGDYWEAADGKRSIDLHGSPGLGGIKQTFKTKKGQKYRLSFSLAGNPDGTINEKKMGVKVAGKQVDYEEFTFNVEGKSRSNMGWTTQVWDFTATDKETTLELFTTMTMDENYGAAIDNVSVVELNE